MNAQPEFGYPWWLSYGHLIPLAVGLTLFTLSLMRRWPKLLTVLFGTFALWSAGAFLVARFVLDVNGRASMPTQNFLRSNTGRVLDMGAGTGRSSIMVLEERPGITLVALDLFSKSYEAHFGTGASPEERLVTNLKAAGVRQRASIKTADMRELPFEQASFDAIVSAYAIDHLNSEGVRRSLDEAARVLKPGGEFLFMILGKDPWIQFAFGPLLLHSRTRGPDWWVSRLQDAGFQIKEQGTRRGTLYLLAQR